MYCENCGSELNVNSVCLCDNCGCKNTKHYDANEFKKAVKYINIFFIIISSIILILLCLSIYGYIKSDKIDHAFNEPLDDLDEYITAEYLYGIESEYADLYRQLNRLRTNFSIANIHYEKCIIYFGIAFILLVIFGIIANRIYHKKHKNQGNTD